MILIDFSSLILNTILDFDKNDVDLHNSRIAILNQLRLMNRKFKRTHGKMVICYDDKKNYWRKDVFPYYKAGRAAVKDNSKFNWDVIHEIIETLYLEFKDNLPYVSLKVHRCEADDIIGYLCERFGEVEPIMIISADKDFLQLQRYKRVQQYTIRDRGRYLETDDPIGYLQVHILKGDRGDGIPNVKSPSDFFINGVGRQQPITQKFIDEYAHLDDLTFLDESIEDRRKVNDQLVDLKKIPQDLKADILKAYIEFQPTKKMHLMKYLAANGATNLFTDIQDF
jgi:5'-3' exonuclease